MIKSKCTLAAIALLIGSLSAAAHADQNVVVVLDDSGSMNETMRTNQGRVRRIDAAKKALVAVLSKLPADTNVGVIALNSSVQGSNWVVPFGPSDPRQWQSNVNQIRADGGTPLGAYLKVGTDTLLEARKKQIYGTYRLLVVTDGEANDARLVDVYLPDILTRGILVDVIGVDMQATHSLATRVHNYRSADDESALEAAISEVFAETAVDDQDAEADFEMLAALPDGFATQAIAALSAGGNEPIAGLTGDESDVNITFGNSNSTSPAAAVIGTSIGGLVCCFGTLLGIVVIVGVIARVAKRR